MHRAFRRTRLTVVLMACLGIAGATDRIGRAQDEAQAKKDWSVTADMTLSGKYVWRGINTVDDPVLQPSLSFTYLGLTAYGWGNQDLTDVNGRKGRMTEVDLGLEYTVPWNQFDFTAGALNYQFPRTGFPTTTEVYGAVAWRTLLKPTVKLYQDVDENHGRYATISAGHTFEDLLTFAHEGRVGARLGGSVGYGSTELNRYYYATGHPGFTDACATAAVPVKLTAHWTVTPSLNWTTLLDGGIRRAMSNDTNLWYGLSLTFAF